MNNKKKESLQREQAVDIGKLLEKCESAGAGLAKANPETRAKAAAAMLVREREKRCKMEQDVEFHLS